MGNKDEVASSLSWRETIGYHLTKNYTTPIGTLIIEERREVFLHNSMMIEIIGALFDIEFVNIKDMDSTRICGIK